METLDYGDEAASWLSDFLGQPCRLIKQNPNYTRDMKNRPSGGKVHPSVLPSLNGLFNCILHLSDRVMRDHVASTCSCDLTFPPAD